MFKDIRNICDDEIDRRLIFFVAEVRNKSGKDCKPNNLVK